MSVWPSNLKISRNISEQPAENVIRSDMDLGPAKLRRRTVANVRNFDFTLDLTDNLLEVFDNFYTENDAYAFDFVHPRTKKNCRARFRELPSYKLNETLWEVSVKLEILP